MPSCRMVGKFKLVERPHPMVNQATQRLYKTERGTVLSAVRANDSERWEAAVLDEAGEWLTRTIFPRADRLEQDVLFGVSEDGLTGMLDMITSWEERHR